MRILLKVDNSNFFLNDYFILRSNIEMISTHCCHFAVVNCEMSEWGEYSECSSSCGSGTKSRERQILVKPRFGGTACPQNLRQTTICIGTSCEETEVKLEEEVEKGEIYRYMFISILVGCGDWVGESSTQPIVMYLLMLKR